MRIRRTLMTSALALAAASSAHAQEVGIGATVLRSSRPDMPGGPGASLVLSWSPRPLLRVEAVATREWGRETVLDGTCAIYWPVATDCVAEPVRRRNTVTSGELIGAIVSPDLLGFRIGLGGGIGGYAFDVSLHGERSDRVQRPAAGANDLILAPTVLGLIEYAGGLDRRLRISLRAQRIPVNLKGCVTDVWALCGEETFDRVSLSAHYRVR